MAIEKILERIVFELDRIANALENQNAPTTQSAPASAPTPVAAPPRAASAPGPALATGPVGGPPVDVPPTTAPLMGAPGAGVPSPITGTAPGAPGPTAPATSAPAPTQTPQTPVQGVPTLDDIKALANDFHRAHPERAAEFVQVLAGKNAQKLSELPPASYPEVHGILKQMMGQG